MDTYIYRCLIASEEDTMEKVTITCYASTHNLSIQGSLHYIWACKHLHEIEQELRLNSSSRLCRASTPEPKSANVSLPPSLPDESDSDISTSSVMPDHEHMPTVTSAKPVEPSTEYVDVPSIPTRNSYCILEVEDLPDVTDDDDDLPPIPLPWKCSKKSATPTKLSQHQPSPSKFTTPTQCSDISSTQQSTPPCTSTARTSTRTPVRNTILVLGDSMPKNLVGRRMSRRYRVLNRCIPGTSLEIWAKLAPVFVEEESPTAVIIHCGTNNIHRTLPMESITTMEKLITAVNDMNSYTSILVSSLIVQENIGHSYWIAEFNARLHDLCLFHECTFIDNRNILHSHLAEDGLHLNKQGTLTLARNFISVIQSLPSKDFQLCPGNRTVK